MLNLSKESPYGVIVCGAGHAGCEAALASARMGVRTLLHKVDSFATQSLGNGINGVFHQI